VSCCVVSLGNLQCTDTDTARLVTSLSSSRDRLVMSRWSYPRDKLVTSSRRHREVCDFLATTSKRPRELMSRVCHQEDAVMWIGHYGAIFLQNYVLILPINIIAPTNKVPQPLYKTRFGHVGYVTDTGRFASALQLQSVRLCSHIIDAHSMFHIADVIRCLTSSNVTQQRLRVIEMTTIIIHTNTCI